MSDERLTIAVPVTIVLADGTTVAPHHPVALPFDEAESILARHGGNIVVGEHQAPPDDTDTDTDGGGLPARGRSRSGK